MCREENRRDAAMSGQWRIVILFGQSREIVGWLPVEELECCCTIRRSKAASTALKTLRDREGQLQQVRRYPVHFQFLQCQRIV